ncbi:SDR family oxidoreductase [Imperialibacter roseus]|uniref:SDR family oxidoreductase n=1 Tax=Imperialibacter roseus TaxID=1324217 RepID=A0ABZ0IKC8_9BACT|nr:SDR family oxidoreductase [Imperialibacter roseus]WOK04991.1 SDR family oxidoreductase [Imperialibacter roseus]|tara:strand:+ start:14191 stop:15027 length:837 start_codon:yes stop_codon:yes gene_type:complete
MENSTSKKSVSVLGCGWLGLPLARHLLQNGFKIKGSTTSPEKLALLKKTGIEPFLIQLSDGGDYSQLSDFLTSDILIVNYPPGVRKGGAEQFRNSFGILLDSVAKSLVGKIIYISSTSVYPNTNEVVSEEMQLLPDSEAGKVLLDAEDRLRKLDGKEVIILRMAGLIGHDRQPARFFAGKKGLANGEELVNLIHRDDCVNIIHKMIEGQASGDTFNCCSDTHPPKRDFYTKASEVLGIVLPQFAASDVTSFKIVSNEKLKSQLKYNFIYGDLTKFDWP